MNVCLKCGRCVTETEGHDEVFEMTIPCPKGRFVFITSCYTKSLVSFIDVQLRKTLGSFDSIELFRNKRQEILVFDSYSVQCTVIDTKAKRAIRFFDKQGKRSKRRCGRPDKSLAEVIFNIFFENLQFTVSERL